MLVFFGENQNLFRDGVKFERREWCARINERRKGPSSVDRHGLEVLSERKQGKGRKTKKGAARGGKQGDDGGLPAQKLFLKRRNITPINMWGAGENMNQAGATGRV